MTKREPDNLTTPLPPEIEVEWSGCTHLDCLPQCWHGLESGYCERLAQFIRAHGRADGELTKPPEK